MDGVPAPSPVSARGTRMFGVARNRYGWSRRVWLRTRAARGP